MSSIQTQWTRIRLGARNKRENGLTLALTLTLSPRRGNSYSPLQLFRDQLCRIQRPVLQKTGERFSVSPGERVGRTLRTKVAPYSPERFGDVCEGKSGAKAARTPDAGARDGALGSSRSVWSAGVFSAAFPTPKRRSACRFRASVPQSVFPAFHSPRVTNPSMAC